jgi:multicomponent Na+:H+ antiporter subunit G
MIGIIGKIFIALGLALNVIGCLCIIRFTDFYSRLQAGIKGVTTGTGFILFGVFLVIGPTASGIKSLICLVLILLISPVAAHSIARGAYRSERVEKK